MARSLMLAVVMAALPAEAEEISLSFPRDDGRHAEFSTEMWTLHGFFEAADGSRYAAAAMLFDGRWMILSAQVASVGITIHAEPSTRIAARLFPPLFGDVEEAADRLNVRFGRSFMERRASDEVVLSVEAEDLALSARVRGGSVLAPLCGRGETEWDGRRLRGYTRALLHAKARAKIGDRTVQLRGVVRLDHLWGDRMENDYDLLTASLEDGRELTILNVHRGGEQDGSCMTVSGTRGETIAFAGLAIDVVRTWISPRSDKAYPVELRVSAEEPHADLLLVAAHDDQEVRRGIEAYHGPCTVKGSIESKPVVGRCFLMFAGGEGGSK